MPALGAGMDTGRVIEWHVKPGDHVRRGDIVALVETNKANIEVEIFEAGVVEELLVEEGTKVAVGTPLARVASVAAPAEPVAAEPSLAAPPEERVAAAPEPAAAASAEAPAHAAVAADGERPTPAETEPAAVAIVTSPLVRLAAKEAGVDLHDVRGTGPGGAITRQDIAAAAASRPAAASEATPPPPEAPPSPGVRVSPHARRLAAERGVDPATLVGSGPEGVVVARDVPAEAAAPTEAPAEAAAPADVPAEAAAPARPERLAEVEDRGLAMRQAIARAMERANREIPHYYLGETIDVEDTLAWLAELNAERPPIERVLPAALVLKATALALRDYPDLNGYWIDDAFRPGEGIHIGVAISLRRGGLLAPAIRDVDTRSLDELMEALKDLVERTRAGGLRGSELTDPTITVSNLGDTGVETIQGVITPPQVALVGVGRITERPWAVERMLTVRRTIYLSLAGDHRASDGHRGGRFLRAIAANLAEPETL